MAATAQHKSEERQLSQAGLQKCFRSPHHSKGANAEVKQGVEKGAVPHANRAVLEGREGEGVRHPLDADVPDKGVEQELEWQRFAHAAAGLHRALRDPPQAVREEVEELAVYKARNDCQG